MRSTAGGDGLSVAIPPDLSLPRSTSNGWVMLSLRSILSFPVLLAGLLVGAVLVPARLFVVDPDTWWHIKVGETILATHHWPTTDPYSFTVTGQPWIAYEWLGEVLWGAVMHAGGARGLEILLVVLGSAVMLALYGYATLSCGNSKAAFVACAVLFVLAEVSFTLRPQMLGYLFLILTMIALELFRQGRQAGVWFLPILFLLWVNTHGSFVIGLAAILVYWLCGIREFSWEGVESRKWSPRERRTLSIVFMLCLSVLPLTPYGTQLAVYPFDMAFSQPINVANIEEWQSMPFTLLAGKVFLALLIGLIASQVFLRRRWRLEELILALFGVAMACLHVRFLLLFVPFFAPVLARILARWVPPYNRSKDRVLLNMAILAVMAWAVVHYLPSQTEIETRIADRFPVKAVKYLEAHPVQGRMFNNYSYGGYLVWALGPDKRDFIDGRADVYERGGVLADYVYINLLKPGAMSVLNAYGVRACLLERNQPLATVLSLLPAWRAVYTDNQTVLFVRSDGLPSKAGY